MKMLQSLNLDISEKEISQAIHALPLNKSPEADGFSAKYRKAFKTILVPYMWKLFNTAISFASFPKEMFQDVIVALPKPGKKRTHSKTSSLYPSSIMI